MSTHRFVRIFDQTTGKVTVVEYTAGDTAGIYTAAEQARLAIGLPVQRGATTHIDLLAFHDRMTGPDRSAVVSLQAFRARLIRRLHPLRQIKPGKAV